MLLYTYNIVIIGDKIMDFFESEIDLADVFMMIYNLFIILLLVFGVIWAIISEIIDRKRRKKKIEFDEFDDIESIKQQLSDNGEELEYEHQSSGNAYDTAYTIAITDAMLNAGPDGISDHDIELAEEAAKKSQNELAEALYKNKNHNVREEIITEGSTAVKLKENGYNFNVDLFKKWSTQIFKCIKIRSEDNLEIVKNFISEELYAKFEKQMKQFKDDGLEFITEDLIIEKCTLHDYSKSMSKEEIKVLISAIMKEYIMEKSTNTIIRGDNKKFHRKKIFMTFTKKNISDTEGLIHNCPNCGAEITQTEFGKCRYCNTLVIPIRYNWTLTKFETL